MNRDGRKLHRDNCIGIPARLGVPGPNASGQAITKTVIVTVSANGSGCPIRQNHTAKVASPKANRSNYRPLRGLVRKESRQSLCILRLLREFYDLRQYRVGPNTYTRFGARPT